MSRIPTEYARNKLEASREREERFQAAFVSRFPNLRCPGIDGATPADRELAMYNAFLVHMELFEAVETAMRIKLRNPQCDGKNDPPELKRAIAAIETMLKKTQDIPDQYAEIKSLIDDTRAMAKRMVQEYRNPQLPGAVLWDEAPTAPTALATVSPSTAVVKLPAHADDARALLPYDKSSHAYAGLVLAPYQTNIEGKWEEKGTKVDIKLKRIYPDPWECRLDTMDIILANLTHGLWLQNYQQPKWITIEEITRLAYGMRPGDDVPKSRSDEVQKRLDYLTGRSNFPRPSNMRMYKKVGDEPGLELPIILASYSEDTKQWLIHGGSMPTALAYQVERIGKIRPELLYNRATGKRASYTDARAALEDWLRRRLADYQGIDLEKSNAKAAEASQEKTALATEQKQPDPVLRTIYLAEMLADTWEATALPKPENGGAYYRVVLRRRIKTVSEILADLATAGAITDYEFKKKDPPPPDVMQAAQRWAAANAPDTDGQWMAPKGAFVIMGPFAIRIIKGRKTPQLLPGSKPRGRPPKKPTNNVTQ